MTSVATICGHFPLTLVRGPGAAARNSIGIVLVAGMALGTAFTLFFVPAIYVLIARDHRSAKKTASESDSPADEGLPAGLTALPKVGS
jgi:multidrug efflux pump